VPVPEGVKTPAPVMVPPVAVHVTALLKAPVPVTEDGVAETLTPVMVLEGAATASVADPHILV
jgi:hypothetical protein